jgi:phosphoserine phosphatase
LTPKFRLVFFDVDSTLVTIEGIDVLAGGNPEVAKLTEAAMNGEIPLDQVYARRLEMIRPNRDAIMKLRYLYAHSLVDGAMETLVALKGAGAVVHFVSAGIEQAVISLGWIFRAKVHAVALEYTESGEYKDFDRRSPLTRPGGKEIVVRDVRARTHGKAAFVGDGISDLEAKPAVDLFIGFGGVHTRPRVRDNADVFVSGPRLDDVLPYLI